MKKIIQYIKIWLNKPYSFREELDFQITCSAILSLTTFLVLYILKPFGLNALDNDLLQYFAGYGVICLCVMLFIFLVGTRLFPKVLNNNSWNVGKEIVIISGTTFVIGTVAYFYHHRVAVGNLDPN